MSRLFPLATVALFACAPPTLTGTVFKGPMQSDELTVESVDHYDTTVPYETIESGGRYTAQAQSGVRFHRVSARGTYFDETTGDDSIYPAYLVAIVEPDRDGTVVHVNALTTLAWYRANRLHDDGTNYRDGLEQAELELVEALDIGTPGFALAGRALAIDPYEDTRDAAWSLAVNAILVSAIGSDPIWNDNVDDLMIVLGTDFADSGTLEPESLAALALGESALDVVAVRTHLEEFYSDEDLEGVVPAFEAMIDSDGDGSYADVDCDDHDATAHPGGTEVCEWGYTDEDCDGLVDDADDSVDLATRLVVYQDQDGDGHGTAAATQLLCHPAEGWAETSDDCDDTDIRAWAACATCGDADGDGGFAGCDVYPNGEQPDCDDDDNLVFFGAPERCNGLDDDCLGVGLGLPPAEIDNDDDGYVDCVLAVPAATWGNAEAVIVIGGGDCDDLHSTVRPGAPERCDGVYTDCDDRGAASAAPPDESDDEAGGGDGYIECDLEGPWLGPGQRKGGDCDDTDAGVHPGAFDTWGDGDGDCDGSDLAAFVVSDIVADPNTRPSSGVTSDDAGTRFGIATRDGGCIQMTWLEVVGGDALSYDSSDDRCVTTEVGNRIDFEAAPPPAGPVTFPQAATVAWSHNEQTGAAGAALWLCRYLPASDSVLCDQDFVDITATQDRPYASVDVRARPDQQWWRLACGEDDVALAATGFGVNVRTDDSGMAGHACFVVPESDTFDVVICDQDCTTWTWDLVENSELVQSAEQDFEDIDLAEAVTYGPLMAGRHQGLGMTLWDFGVGQGWTLFGTYGVQSVAARQHDGVDYVFARITDNGPEELRVLRGDPAEGLESIEVFLDPSIGGALGVDLLVNDEGVLLLATVGGSGTGYRHVAWSWNPFP